MLRGVKLLFHCFENERYTPATITIIITNFHRLRRIGTRYTATGPGAASFAHLAARLVPIRAQFSRTLPILLLSKPNLHIHVYRAGSVSR